MDKSELLKYAGLEEAGPPPVTREDPLVLIHDIPKGKEQYPDQGIMGHMNLSTAGRIHDFKVDKELADMLFDTKRVMRIKVKPKVYLSMSPHTEKELKEAVSNVIAGDIRSPIYRAVNDLANAIYREAKELAGEVYDEEGPEKAGQNRREYIRMAVKRFLDKEYQSALMNAIVDEYKEMAE